MSFQYDKYLDQHKANVKRGFDWIQENLPELLKGGFDYGWQICFAHDQSKSEPDEYKAYDAYFYGGNRSYSVVRAYEKAWLIHLHRNPHHWQHWILINDDPKEGELILEMPYNYIVEMICDWWAFSWQKGKLDEIFSWYDEHSEYMKLHPTTRKTIENILVKMKAKLGSNNDSLEEIYSDAESKSYDEGYRACKLDYRQRAKERKQLKIQEKRRRLYFLKQKVIGVFFLVFTIFAIKLLDGDATIALLTVPLSLMMIFSKEKWWKLREMEGKNDETT